MADSPSLEAFAATQRKSVGLAWCCRVLKEHLPEIEAAWDKGLRADVIARWLNDVKGIEADKTNVAYHFYRGHHKR